MVAQRHVNNRKKLLYFAIAALLILVIAQLSLPFAVRKYVLHTLNKIPGYRTQVASIHINLLRGAYKINNIKLEKTQGEVPVPFFSAETIDLSIQWSELIHGALVGQ